MKTDVRLATEPEDFERFRDLAIEYENSLPQDLRHVDFARQLETLRDHYGAPNAAFIATADNVSAGCVALARLNESTAVVKKLYVKPEYRQLGLARALVGALVNFARRSGFARLVLDTERDRLQAAYKLYLSLGFKDCEPYGAVDYASPTFMRLDLR
jgi:carbonic anhydrase